MIRSSTASVHNLAAGEPRELGRWLGNGIWAVADHGVFALANFILSVALARWLSPHDYGAFAVGFAIFWLLGTFQIGLLSEPMIVFGAGKHRDRLRGYLDAAVMAQAGFAALSTLVLFLAALGAHIAASPSLASTLASLGVAAPGILFLWFLRNVAYVAQVPAVAVAGGLFYGAAVLVGIYALHVLDDHRWLSPASAVGVMGVSSLVAALWLAARLKLRLPRGVGRASLRAIVSEHWRYGRWATGTQMLVWFSTSIWYVVLPVGGGLAASGALRALLTPIIPLGQALYALSRYLVGMLVRTRGETQFRKLVTMTFVPFMAFAVPYWFVLTTWGESLLGWLYGGQYGEYGSLLWLFGLLVPIEGLRAVFHTALQARERPDLIFRSYVLASLAVCIAGLPLLVTSGIIGAGIGLLLAYAVGSGSMAAFFLRTQSSSARAPGMHERGKVLTARSAPDLPA